MTFAQVAVLVLAVLVGIDVFVRIFGSGRRS